MNTMNNLEEITINVIELIGEMMLVEPIDKHSNKGGLIIPESKKEKPTLGKIIKIGNGFTLDKDKPLHIFLKEDQTVLFKEWSGTKIEISGKNYLLLKQSDVLGYCLK